MIDSDQVAQSQQQQWKQNRLNGNNGTGSVA